MVASHRLKVEGCCADAIKRVGHDCGLLNEESGAGVKEQSIG
jgi:hypothetical protein